VTWVAIRLRLSFLSIFQEKCCLKNSALVMQNTEGHRSAETKRNQNLDQKCCEQLVQYRHGALPHTFVLLDFHQ